MSMKERKVGISVSGKYKPPHKIPLIMGVRVVFFRHEKKEVNRGIKR